MAKSSQDQEFEEIHNYQEPERPDPREYYINARGKEVSLDFFLYSCLEEEKTCDALRGDFASQLTLKRWAPLIPYIEEEVFDERDERVSTEEVAGHTPEELIEHLCRWYAETYPQLAGSETLDYFVHMEMVQEFVLLTKDLKAMLSAKKVRLSDRLPGVESSGTEEGALAQEPEGSVAPVTELKLSAETPVTAQEAIAPEADHNGNDKSPENVDEVVAQSETPPEAAAGETQSSEPEVAATTTEIQQAPSEEIQPELQAEDSAVVKEEVKEEEVRPTYSEILGHVFSDYFPAYSRLMMEYVSWTNKKSARFAPDLANLPPVGRYLNLLRKRSGGGRFRDDDRSGPGRDRGRRDRPDRGRPERSNRDRDNNRDRDRHRDRDRGRRSQEFSEGHENAEREGKAIKEAKKGLSFMKNNPEKDSFQLPPENSFIRRVQHKYIKDQPGFSSRSAGDGQERAVKITRKS